MFDPYYLWLGIPPDEQPPHHYRLLGIKPLESNTDVISNAADRQMLHVKSYQSGPHSAHSQKLLNEIVAAKVCLLNAPKKAAYDQALRAQPGVAAATRLPLAMPVGAAAEGAVDASAAADETSPQASETRAGRAGRKSAARAGVAGRKKLSTAATILLFGLGAIATLAAAAVAYAVWRYQNMPTGSDQTVAEHSPDKSSSDKKIAVTTPDDADGAKTPPTDAPAKAGNASPPAAQIVDISNQLAVIRRALAERHIDQAQAAWQSAGKVAASKSQQIELARLGKIVDLEAAFFTAFAAAAGELRAGDELVRDSVPLAIVTSVSRDQVVLRRDGSEEVYAKNGLPAELAIALAEQQLPSDAQGKAAVGAFLAMDSGGDRAQAGLLWREADSPAMTTSELMAELAVPLPAGVAAPKALAVRAAPRDKPPVEPPREEHPAVAVAKPQKTAVTLLDDSHDERWPVPEPQAVAEAMKLVGEVFKEDYARATKATEKAALAETMLKRAIESEDPAECYALVSAARKLAVASGNAALLERVTEQLAARFAIDKLASLTADFEKMNEKELPAALRRQLAEATAGFIQRAAAEEKFDLATRLAAVCQSAAAKSGHRELAKWLTALVDQLAEWRGQFDAAKQARATLKNRADDPAANGAVGKYLCLYKGDWDEGLPHLVQGSDKALRKLAQQEIDLPLTPADQLALADGWWDLSESADGLLKDRLRIRAGNWYEQAAGQLSGLSKKKVEKRLEEVRGLAVSIARPSIEPPAETHRDPSPPPRVVGGQPAKSPAATVPDAASIKLPSGTAISPKSLALTRAELERMFPDPSRVYVRKDGPARIAALFTYRQGKLDGPSATFYPTEKAQTLAQYGLGKRDGTVRTWDNQGQREWFAQYKKGQRQGLTCLFKNDRLWLVQEWDKDTRVGQYLFVPGSDTPLAERDLSADQKRDLDDALERLRAAEESYDKIEEADKDEFAKAWAVRQKQLISEAGVAKRKASAERQKALEQQNGAAMNNMLRRALRGY